MKNLIKIAQGKFHQILSFVILDICSILLNIYINFKAAEIIGSLINFNGFNLTMTVTLTVLLMWFAYILIENLRITLKEYIISRLNFNYRNLIARSVSNMKYSDFIKEDKGEYLSWLINDSQLIEQKTYRNLFDATHFLLSIVFSFIAISYLSLWLSLSSIVFFILMITFPGLFSKKTQLLTSNFSKQQSMFTTNVKSNLYGYEIWDNYSAIDSMINNINLESHELENKKFALSRFQTITNSLVQLLSIVIQFSNQILFIYLSYTGIVNPIYIITIGNLSGLFYNSLGQFAQLIPMINSTKHLISRISNTDSIHNTLDTNAFEFKNHLVIEHLYFQYDDSKELLKNINLKINKGEKIAIIAPSGTGKTTLLKILMKRLENYRGNIILDETNYNDLTSTTINQLFAYIDQSSYTFNSTILDNITLGKIFELNHVIEQTNLSKLNTLVKNIDDLTIQSGEDGKNLSNGEKQRIAIARALLFKKQIILFDEADNAIDKENSLAIKKMLFEQKDLTLIYISHALLASEHINFDQVIELE